jgi:hypothetical protein
MGSLTAGLSVQDRLTATPSGVLPGVQAGQAAAALQERSVASCVVCEAANGYAAIYLNSRWLVIIGIAR